MGSSLSPARNRSGAAILGRIVHPSEATLNPEAARAILDLSFDPDDQARVSALLEKNQQGALHPEERAELDEYLQVDAFLSILQSKARLSLKRAGLLP